MRILRHLVASDVRRHKWLLTMWSGVVITSALFDGIRPELALKPGIHAAAGLLDALIWWSWLVIAVAIVPLVIQSHPLVGSDAFWMTRPIAPGQLFASKALLVGTVTLVLPAIADLTVMVSHQIPIRDACGVLADSTLWRAICVMTLAVAAAATGSIARFTLVCGAAIIALVAW